VIHDVDESLRALAERDALNGSRVEIAFDAPTREWAARQNAPVVNMYLYDIREDLQRREVAWEPVRGANSLVVEHRPPARRFRLSYMITCWTQRPEDEHRLLSAMLACFLRHPTLPPETLAGVLAEATVPILTTIALPPPPDRSLADVWSALGGELKPSLDLVVTAPMDGSVVIPAAAPVREGPILRMGGGAGAAVGGDVREAGTGRRGKRGGAAGEGAGGPGDADGGGGDGAPAGGGDGAPAGGGDLARGSPSADRQAAVRGERRALSPSDPAVLVEVRTPFGVVPLQLPGAPAQAEGPAAEGPAAAPGGGDALAVRDDAGAARGRRKRGDAKREADEGAARGAGGTGAGAPDATAAAAAAMNQPGRRLIIRSIKRP
jgi:hypothetical protein